jgi:hypothetical protein
VNGPASEDAATAAPIAARAATVCSSALRSRLSGKGRGPIDGGCLRSAATSGSDRRTEAWAARPQRAISCEGCKLGVLSGPAGAEVFNW